MHEVYHKKTPKRFGKWGRRFRKNVVLSGKPAISLVGRNGSNDYCWAIVGCGGVLGVNQYGVVLNDEDDEKEDEQEIV